MNQGKELRSELKWLRHSIKHLACRVVNAAGDSPRREMPAREKQGGREAQLRRGRGGPGGPRSEEAAGGVVTGGARWLCECGRCGEALGAWAARCARKEVLHGRAAAHEGEVRRCELGVRVWRRWQQCTGRGETKNDREFDLGRRNEVTPHVT